jgi:hypothetical protein
MLQRIGTFAHFRVHNVERGLGNGRVLSDPPDTMARPARIAAGAAVKTGEPSESG